MKAIFQNRVATLLQKKFVRKVSSTYGSMISADVDLQKCERRNHINFYAGKSVQKLMKNGYMCKPALMQL